MKIEEKINEWLDREVAYFTEAEAEAAELLEEVLLEIHELRLSLYAAKIERK